MNIGKLRTWEEGVLDLHKSGNQWSLDLHKSGNKLSLNLHKSGNKLSLDLHKSGNQLSLDLHKSGNQLSWDLHKSGNQLSLDFHINKSPKGNSSLLNFYNYGCDTYFSTYSHFQLCWLFFMKRMNKRNMLLGTLQWRHIFWYSIKPYDDLHLYYSQLLLLSFTSFFLWLIYLIVMSCVWCVYTVQLPGRHCGVCPL